METGKLRSRGYTMGNNNNKKKLPPYLLLVLLAIGAAAVSVGILHKMRERRVLAVLLQERDQQLMSFQVLLEKEKEINKEMRRKVDELEAKTSVLSIERAELKNKLMDSETTTTYLTNTQKELEAALVEKESHINQMKENAVASNPASENSHQDESIVAGSNNENATSDTVALDKPESSRDSMHAPAEEENSNITNASESSHQDESIVVGANNENATSEALVPEKSDTANDSVLATAEEQNSYNTTALESNGQDNGSSQEQFLKLTTNMEDGQPQENKGDANGQSDDAPEGSHSDESEPPQWSQKQTDSQEASKEELDGTRQLEDPQGEASDHSRDIKLLEKEYGNTVVKEAEKEINHEGTTSEDSLSEANQNKIQAAEPVANPADVNPSTSMNNEERKETSKRHRRRRGRSRRKRRATVAPSNNDGNQQMEVDAAANP
ncbi:unnamed protein product [Urochloa decumbens]|uniref:Micronuclear linker histone polyprotein-like protein n=1 Tax=Urochloa decumbens TaxID=240449 RepID=A0ABC9D1I4_9POAL